MKTIEEIITNKGLACEYGYNVEVVPLEDVREYMRLYAEQALDEAADKARDYSLEVDKWGIKQTILSIKEQLK